MESTVVRKPHVCMHLLRPEGESWIARHRCAWRLAKQAVVDSCGANPASLVAARAVRGVQRCSNRSTSSMMCRLVLAVPRRRDCSMIPCGQGSRPMDPSEDREAPKALGTGLGEPRREQAPGEG